jgi:hypothetical protein
MKPFEPPDSHHLSAAEGSPSGIHRRLLGRLPASLTKVQKQNRINYLLATMRAGGIIESTGPIQRAAAWK